MNKRHFTLLFFFFSISLSAADEYPQRFYNGSQPSSPPSIRQNLRQPTNYPDEFQQYGYGMPSQQVFLPAARGAPPQYARGRGTPPPSGRATANPYANRGAYPMQPVNMQQSVYAMPQPGYEMPQHQASPFPGMRGFPNQRGMGRKSPPPNGSAIVNAHANVGAPPISHEPYPNTFQQADYNITQSQGAPGMRGFPHQRGIGRKLPPPNTFQQAGYNITQSQGSPPPGVRGFSNQRGPGRGSPPLRGRGVNNNFANRGAFPTVQPVADFDYPQQAHAFYPNEAPHAEPYMEAPPHARGGDLSQYLYYTQAVENTVPPTRAFHEKRSAFSADEDLEMPIDFVVDTGDGVAEYNFYAATPNPDEQNYLFVTFPTEGPSEIFEESSDMPCITEHPLGEEYPIIPLGLVIDEPPADPPLINKTLHLVDKFDDEEISYCEKHLSNIPLLRGLSFPRDSNLTPKKAKLIAERTKGNKEIFSFYLMGFADISECLRPLNDSLSSYECLTELNLEAMTIKPNEMRQLINSLSGLGHLRTIMFQIPGAGNFNIAMFAKIFPGLKALNMVKITGSSDIVISETTLMTLALALEKSRIQHFEMSGKDLGKAESIFREILKDKIATGRLYKINEQAILGTPEKGKKKHSKLK